MQDRGAILEESDMDNRILKRQRQGMEVGAQYPSLQADV